MSEHKIISPLPGTFYRKPSPDAEPFVAIGDVVHAGTVIGLIEVMKQYSELTAEAEGKLVAFKIEDGDAVEAGQTVAIVEG